MQNNSGFVPINLPDISVGILLIMAIDRFQLIVRWKYGKFSRGTINRAIVSTVLLALLCQLHYIVSLHINANGTCITWVDDDSYKYPLIILKMIRILAFLLIFWCSTIASECTLHKTLKDQLLHRSAEQCRERAAIMKILVVMAIMFTITVIPRDLLHLVYNVSHVLPVKRIPLTHKLRETNKSLRLVATSNYIFNVFIYAKLRENFMSSIKSIFACHWKTDINEHNKSVTSCIETNDVSSMREDIADVSNNMTSF